ncbi:MAG: LptF/LptG family permease [Sphaerochaetaceae bacterium]|nr:LptF/LptG family permease [Sphaerochaetaceae bacterium]
MRGGKGDGTRLTLVHRYIAREFLLSFLVAFLFFFFIFFINQILLYAQRILLKQVPIRQMLTLVALSMPQILLYTIPFSTLSGASMVIGNLSSNHEIIAMRALGISLFQMLRSVIISALVLSVITFTIADSVLPVSHLQFKRLYTDLLRTLPTMELTSYSVNEVGDVVIVTQEVQDGYLENPVLFTTNNSGEQVFISAQSGTLELIDLQRFIYKLELWEVSILSSEREAGGTGGFRYGQGESMIYYLDFSSQVEQVRNVSPSQMSSRDLIDQIRIRMEDHEKAISQRSVLLEQVLRDIEQAKHSDETEYAGLSLSDLYDRKASLEQTPPVNFYLQYYRAELHKKFALSASALILTLISFPLSFVNIRHGRLFGFGLSLLVAALYWAMLFVAQTQIIRTNIHPLFLMWAPNLLILSISMLLIMRLRQS